jgi:hypothetical protein
MSANLQALQALAAQPAASNWFRKMLNEIRLSVTDTGEKFTVVAHPEHVEVFEGYQKPQRRRLLFGLFDPGDWYAQQFIIPLKSENIKNLTGIFADNVVTDEELYRIMSFITPHLLRAALGMSVMKNRFLLWLFNMDTSWHQCMLDPQGKETQQSTVEFRNGEWRITDGYQGNVQRKKILTAKKLLEFQQRVHQAEQENTLSGWLALNSWYKQWLYSITEK